MRALTAEEFRLLVLAALANTLPAEMKVFELEDTDYAKFLAAEKVLEDLQKTNA